MQGACDSIADATRCTGSNFSTLLDYFGPTSWLFYAVSAAAVIKLRNSEPHALRPFSVILYPLPPLLVIAIALVIFTSSMMSEPLRTLLAIGFVLLSVPVPVVMEMYEGKKRGRSPIATNDESSSDDA